MITSRNLIHRIFSGFHLFDFLPNMMAPGQAVRNTGRRCAVWSCRQRPSYSMSPIFRSESEVSVILTSHCGILDVFCLHDVVGLSLRLVAMFMITSEHSNKKIDEDAFPELFQKNDHGTSPKIVQNCLVKAFITVSSAFHETVSAFPQLCEVPGFSGPRLKESEPGQRDHPIYAETKWKAVC